MSDVWTQTQQLAAKHQHSGGLFLRLPNDRDKVVVVFRGEPYAREVHWTGERYADCDGAACAPCAAGTKKTPRVAINVYVPAQKKDLVFEGGLVFVKLLLKAREKYGLDAWTFEIERSGAAGDPKTSYTLLPDKPLTDALRAELAARPLHDLKVVLGGPAAPPKPDFQSFAPAKAPSAAPATPALLAPAVAADLVARLKLLPRTALEQFLTTFRVTRIRDVRATDEAAARALVAQLEQPAPREPGADDGDEVDPFAVA